MSWMITDLTKLRGTCYIEVLPGEYKGRSWNPESVYFTEKNFAVIETAIRDHCPDYNPYGFTDIDRSVWSDIVADLERLIAEPVIPLPRDLSRQSASQAEDTESLKEMLIDFTHWARQVMDSNETVSVLGL